MCMLVYFLDIDDDQNSTDDGDKNIKDLRILRNLSGYQYSEYFDPKIFPQVRFYYQSDVGVLSTYL